MFLTHTLFTPALTPIALPISLTNAAFPVPYIRLPFMYVFDILNINLRKHCPLDIYVSDFQTLMSMLPEILLIPTLGSSPIKAMLNFWISRLLHEILGHRVVGGCSMWAEANIWHPSKTPNFQLSGGSADHPLTQSEGLECLSMSLVCPSMLEAKGSSAEIMYEHLEDMIRVSYTCDLQYFLPILWV